MQAAHGDGIIQWAASAVSAPSAMVMYEQTTLWRHLDFIPLGLAFKTMCHVPLLLLFITYLMLRVLCIVYRHSIISSSIWDGLLCWYQDALLIFLTNMHVVHDLAPPNHRTSCHFPQESKRFTKRALSHMWVEFVW